MPKLKKVHYCYGGDVTFSSIDGNSNLTVRPNIGVFVAENFAIGGRGYLYTGDGFTSWRVGPFARYYFTKNTKENHLSELR